MDHQRGETTMSLQTEPHGHKDFDGPPPVFLGLEADSFEIVQTTGTKSLAEVFVVRFPEGRMCEFVDAVDPHYPKKEKWILNLSTQFGCPVGCPFCDAGGGFKGNISANRLLAMARYVVERNEQGLTDQCKKLKIHFSRMGEPALNDAVLEVLPSIRSWLPNPNVWTCLATTAPNGRLGWFQELKAIKDHLFSGRFQLQLSINTTDPEVRKYLVPIDHLSLKELATLGERFFVSGDRKIGLNFALARDVPFQEEVIRSIFDPEIFCVKLTPVNPTQRGKENGIETVLRSDHENEIRESIQNLQENGYEVILSIGDIGEDEIGSNCGQAVRFAANQSTS